MLLTLLEPQSRSGDKPVKFQAVLSPNGTAVLKGLIPFWKGRKVSSRCFHIHVLDASIGSRTLPPRVPGESLFGFFQGGVLLVTVSSLEDTSYAVGN